MESFHAVGVLAAVEVSGTKDFESAGGKSVADFFFGAGTDLQGKPVKAGFRAGYRHFCHRS